MAEPWKSCGIHNGNPSGYPFFNFVKGIEEGIFPAFGAAVLGNVVLIAYNTEQGCFIIAGFFRCK